MMDTSAFSKEGTPERVLLNAMLVELHDGAGGVQNARFTERVQQMFPDGVPPLAALMPQLLNLVQAEIADQSGIISGQEQRMTALKNLQEMGLRDESKHLLISSIERGGRVSAVEVARSTARVS